MEQLFDDFGHLFRSRYQYVTRYIYQRVNDRELSEDLSAEVFALALKKHHSGTFITRRWLILAARNLVGNEYQRRASHRKRLRRVLLEELRQSTGQERFDAIEVREAIARLHPRDAQAVRLAYWQGLPAAEAAKVMQCTPGAFWARLARARADLRELLSERPNLELPNSNQPHAACGGETPASTRPTRSMRGLG